MRPQGLSAQYEAPLSTPSAVRQPDDTAPSMRTATGLVCPACQARFPETDRLTSCPTDGRALVRIADYASADGDAMLGRTLGGRFTLLARIGAGSMGTVYRARQHPVGRDVAIKILRSERAIDEVSRARFLREARANSLLASPHTVTVFDFGQSETGDFFLAMELLEGEALGARLKREGHVPPALAVETARQALRSLAEAHAKGIVHRDLKPDNLFYARIPEAPEEEVVKILDFGIAKMLREHGDLPLNAVETQAGTVFGTPRYMSPEQASAKPLDARSDLYSLGVILYHMLAGRPPFTDDDAIVVMARHIKSMPRPFHEVAPHLAATIPAELERAVFRALAKDPEGRPSTADAMAQELTRALATASGVHSSEPSLRRLVSTPPMVRVSAPPPPRSSLASAPPGIDSLEMLVLGEEHARRARRRTFLAAALVLVVLAVGALGAVFAFGRRGEASPTLSSGLAPPGLAATDTATVGLAPAPPPIPVESLPIAPARPVALPAPSTPKGSRSGPVTPRPAAEGRRASPKPGSGPAPSSTYGLFE